MKINKELVGKAIARLREMRGLTQSELNDLVGMRTIQHIEQGRNEVSLASLNKIADALDIPAACIVLLGSDIDEGDRVLSSLHALLEKTMSLQSDDELKKTRGRSPSVPVDRGGKKKRVVKAMKKKPKR